MCYLIDNTWIYSCSQLDPFMLNRHDGLHRLLWRFYKVHKCIVRVKIEVSLDILRFSFHTIIVAAWVILDDDTTRKRLIWRRAITNVRNFCYFLSSSFLFILNQEMGDDDSIIDPRDIKFRFIKTLANRTYNTGISELITISAKFIVQIFLFLFFLR